MLLNFFLVWGGKHIKKYNLYELVLTWVIFDVFYWFFFATLWSKHRYQVTLRKLRVYETFYHFSCWLRVVNLAKALSFEYLSCIYFFKRDLKFSFLLIIIPKICSSFSTVVSLKGKFGNGSWKPRVRKKYFSTLI